jgi:hypothetical protein
MSFGLQVSSFSNRQRDRLIQQISAGAQTPQLPAPAQPNSLAESLAQQSGLAVQASQGTDLNVTAESATVPTNALASQIIENMIHSPDGLRKLAFAMHPVLKQRLDYHAIGRNNVLIVDEIPTGDVPFYDLDVPEFGAVFLAGRGEPIAVQANVKRIQFPTSALAALQGVPYEDITIRRYPLFDRAKERVAIAIAITEDDAIIGVGGIVETAAAVGPNSIVVAPALTRNVLAEIWKRITRNQLQVGAYVMHPVQYAEILKWSANELDQVTLNRQIETGLIGGYYGVPLLISNRVNEGKVFGLTTPDKFGRLPERKAVEVKIFDNVTKLRYDILGWEQIGLGVYNTAGVAEADVPANV